MIAPLLLILSERLPKLESISVCIELWITLVIFEMASEQ